MRRYLRLLCGVALVFPLASAHAEPVSPVVLAQPAVFRLLVFHDSEVDTPASISTDLQLLRDDYNKAVLGGNLAGLTEPEFYWRKLSEHPARYLHPSTARTHQTTRNKADASGSAFAVSEEGILITNAHMVSDDSSELLQDPKYVFGLLQQPFVSEWNHLTLELRGSPAAADTESVTGALLLWYASQSAFAVSYKGVHVVLRYDTPEKSLLSTVPEMPVAVEATTSVLAVGRGWPGKDVAILKIEPGSVTFASHDFAGRTSLERVKDLHLICLPTADSDHVLPGTRVHALGFPGAAVGPEMADSAAYVVNSQPGEIGHPVDMKDGWKAFPLSSAIDHGDSGGPVVDEQGNAIAVNVAGMQGGYNFAVPINLATDLLLTANITPKCSVNAAWEKAVRLYYDKHYTDAANDLERIARQQAGLDWLTTGGLSKVDMQNPQASLQEAFEASKLFLRPKGHEHPGVSAAVLELEAKAASLR